MPNEQAAPAAVPAAPVAPAQTPPAKSDAKEQLAAPTPEAPKQPSRGEEIARIKRMEARAFAERQKLIEERKSWEAQQAQALKKAQAFDALDKMSVEDPLKFLEVAGLKVPELSKRYIEQTTGANKTPAQLAREEAERVWAEKEAIRRAEQERSEKEASAKRNEQILSGAKNEIKNIARSDPEKFELINDDIERSTAMTWDLIEEAYKQNGTVPKYSEALEAVEEFLERSLTNTFTNSKKIKTALERLRAEADAKAKSEASRAAGGTKTRLTDSPRHVAEETKTQPSSTTVRRKYDPRAAASELWAKHRAALDN